MSTLLLYQTKQGHTKSCIDYIQENLEDSTVKSIQDMGELTTTYTNIIIGTPIYMGHINKDIKTFLESNEATLLKTPVSIIVCAMNIDEYDETIQRNFTPAMRHHAQIVHGGGGYDFKKLNFLERLVVKKIAKVKQSLSQINTTNLDHLLQSIQLKKS